MRLSAFENWIGCDFSYCFHYGAKQAPVCRQYPDLKPASFTKIFFASSILLWLALGPAMAASHTPNILKVPCRDMGDGRTLIDSSYLPDDFDFEKSSYTILRTQPTSMKGEWANLVCTIEIKEAKSDQPAPEATGDIDYLNLESFDFGFAIKQAPGAAFSVDIPKYWNRTQTGQDNQLVFASPDDDPDAKMTLAITGELANGRTDREEATAHARELQNIGDAKIIEQGPVKTAAGQGWRVLLKVVSPSDIDILLVDELVVIQSGPALYKLEMTAPEPVWHVGEQIMKRALDSLYIAK